MAELATGAVSSLLGVIRNEAQLLGGVRGDVQFIKEEMESMNSFLLHLARTAPPGGEHDEQVRTWMDQVRLLASDCNNCIDRYLNRRSYDVQFSKGGLTPYFLWAYWCLYKAYAKHRAAIELRELKNRARDVGERRMRYGVEVPEKGASAKGAGDKEDDGDDQLAVVATVGDRSDPKASFKKPRTLDEYLEAKLLQWITTLQIHHHQNRAAESSKIIPSIAIVVAPDNADNKGTADVAYEALAVVRAAENRTNLSVLVDVPSVHLDFQPLRPRDILYYIMRELEHAREPDQHAKSQSRAQREEEGGTDHDQGDDEAEQQFIEWERKWSIYFEKRELMEGIKRNVIRTVKLHTKIEKIRNELEQRKDDKLLLQSLNKRVKVYDKNKLKTKISEKPLPTLFLLLNSVAATADEDQVRNKDKRTLARCYNYIIKETAKKLQGLMELVVKEEDQEDDDEGEHDYNGEEEDEKEEEEDDDDKEEEEGGNSKRIEEDNSKGKEAVANKEEPIHLHADQYASILREVFPKISKQGKEQSQGLTIGTTSTVGDNQIKEIVQKVKLEILRELLPAAISDGKYPQAQEEDNLVTVQATNPTTILSEDPSTEKSGKKHAAMKSEGQDQDLQDATVQVTVEKEDAGTSNNNFPQDTNLTTIVPGDGPSKKDKTKDKRSGQPDGQDQYLGQLGAIVQETKVKMEEVKRKINKELKIRGVTNRIKGLLNNKSAMVILKINELMIDVSTWEETRNALSSVGGIAGAVIVTTPSDTQRVMKEYCYPPHQEPIKYSLVGFYQDNVLELISQKMNDTIIHDILDNCKLHEFSMKIFSHALYANPKRRSEDLHKLNNTLQKVVSSKSNSAATASIAKKVFKFSYNDLPKEYRSCMLYLAIFPPNHKIRRSTLIGRWVAEGLVTTEDWIWSNSVRKAKTCFDELIRRLFVYPADVSAAGQVKSCMVENQVHDFITKIAEKQHIMEARLSHHLARHFSIYNDLRLRGSDTIVDFLEKLSRSSPSLKVLDLENCQCFNGKMHFLKVICNNILLLKYLSLRRTDATQLPTEINNLQELEVLDIRETKVPARATRNVKLLKLKRLLAGDTDLNLNCTDIASVQVPEKVENMEHMEVLSNVKAVSSKDLKDIATLWQLRKLGVVIEDKHSHLKNLLQLISDLHKRLRSLSITLCPTIGHEGTRYSRGFSVLRNTTREGLQSTTIDGPTNPPKLLESLSISGTTQRVDLLKKLLGKDGKEMELVKVTLSNTLLKQEDLEVLAKLPKLCCFRLRNISCTKSGKLTFTKDGFPNLKYFLFEGSNMNDICFEAGAIPGLDEIILTFTTVVLPNINAATAAAATTTTTGVHDDLPELEGHESNNSNTTTTGVDGPPTPVPHKSDDNNTVSTTTTTEVDGLTKLEQELNTTNSTAAAATAVSAPPELEKQKPKNSTVATSNTTTAVAATTATGADGLPKQECELSTTTTTTRNNMLLPLFDNNAKQIAKVTLCGTLLKEGDLRKLAEKPKLQLLALLEKSYVDSKLTFNKDEFPKLNVLIVNCSDINEISFTSRSAPKLEKIIWTFTNDKMDYSLSGINNLPKLKDFEYNGGTVPQQVQEALGKHRNKLVPKRIEKENQEQTIQNVAKTKNVACFPFCWKNQV